MLTLCGFLALFKMTDIQSPIAKLGLLRQSHKEIVGVSPYRDRIGA